MRSSVEEALSELLEAEKLTQAGRYERNERRQGYRSGHYSRNLTAASRDVTLKAPKLKGNSFEAAIIERYRRLESSVEEALIEMYLAGASVRRVEDITKALWGGKVSPATISFIPSKPRPRDHWKKRTQLAVSSFIPSAAPKASWYLSSFTATATRMATFSYSPLFSLC